MSLSERQARRVAEQVLAEDARRSNIRNLRPVRGEVFDVNAELRQLSLDAYDWTLITVGLDKLGSQGARELAREIEMRLAHPSAQIPTDSDPTPARGFERPIA